jgi:heat shock protein HslJ
MLRIKTLHSCVLLIAVSTLSGCGTFKEAIGLDDKYSQRLVENTWEIKSIRGMEATSPQPLTIHFDSTSKILGFSGCGYYTAEYWIRGNRVDIMGISPVSRSTCDREGVLQESKLIESLRWTRRIRIEGDGTLLLSARGGPPLKLVPSL